LHRSIIIALVFVYSQSSGQTLGGNSAFNFLKLSNTPQLTALGGVNVSHISNDAGMAFNDPAMLTPSMNTLLNAVFNDFYAKSNIYHLSVGCRADKWATNFLWGLQYFDYGSTTETDAAGNVLGKFRPTDWVMHFTASRNYLETWNYGITVKFINSNYGPYRSNGLAADFGVLYRDSSKLFSAGALVKNLGFQIKKYEGTAPDDLPFDLQAGLTQRLKDAPFSFSLTVQHMHKFNIRYNDTAYNNSNGFQNEKGRQFFGKLIDHLIVATTLYAGERIEVQAGYNFLRRRELNIGNSGNGLNGFSLGVGAKLGKVNVRYARAYYQSNTAYNQFGISFRLKN
jgi:hypothetical protein